MKKAEGNRDKENKSHRTAFRGSLQCGSLPWRTTSHSGRTGWIPPGQTHGQHPARAQCSGVYLVGEAPGRGRTARSRTRCSANAQTPASPSYPRISDPRPPSPPAARGPEIHTPGHFPNVFAPKVLGSASWAGWLSRGRGKLTTAIFTLTFATTIKCSFGHN